MCTEGPRGSLKEPFKHSSVVQRGSQLQVCTLFLLTLGVHVREALGTLILTRGCRGEGAAKDHKVILFLLKKSHKGVLCV